jgi:hypothetical protein
VGKAPARTVQQPADEPAYVPPVDPWTTPAYARAVLLTLPPGRALQLWRVYHPDEKHPASRHVVAWINARRAVRATQPEAGKTDYPAMQRRSVRRAMQEAETASWSVLEAAGFDVQACGHGVADALADGCAICVSKTD